LNTSKAIREKIQLSIGRGESFSFDVKRDDLIDPVISGNKWRKLKYNILKVKALNKNGVLTFGGPFSNHLIATAKSALDHNLKAVGIVRGEELNEKSNKTLKACSHYGMNLMFVTRNEYQQRNEPAYLKTLSTTFLDYFVIPEGGRSFYGAIGCQAILKETTNDYDHVYLAGGTGTTAAGLILAAPEKTTVNVVSALKGSFLNTDISALLFDILNEKETVDDYMKQLHVINDGHFGGYAKVPAELLKFINFVYGEIHLKLDPIYTGKAFYCMIEDFKSGRIKGTDKVLFVHTGGLQGAYSWKEKIDFF